MAQKAPIWWSNSIFFVSMHVAGVIGGAHVRPWTQIPMATKLLWFISWQLASFGVTLGYHRCWSHRSFTARRRLRVVLAIMGSLGFQGSIKWWCLRHRLHHRYTDDPVLDPYAATKGLLFSHMGWIFRRPKYERLNMIDKDDLERDPVVCWQHKYYIPIALFFGLILPALIGRLWGDALGGFIWGGIVARLFIWHCTFFVNSLAHWEGLQPYTDEVTARSSVVLALLTSGEGNHNFHHAFPHDFRAGYANYDWDPTKWIIWALYNYTDLVTSVRQAKESDIQAAVDYMRRRPEAGLFEFQELRRHSTTQDHVSDSGVDVLSDESELGDGANRIWKLEDLKAFIKRCPSSLPPLIIDGWIVDATPYMKEHPGGTALLRKYAIAGLCEEPLQDASWAFNGGLNNHSRSAKVKMRELRVARLASDVTLM